MKHILTLLLVTLYLPTQLQAQIFWEISGNGLKEPSYLLGTIHIGDARVYDFPDSMLTYFEKCDAFAGELDLININFWNSFEIMAQMKMPGDTTLQDLLAPKEYAFIHQKLEKQLGFLTSTFEKWYPFLLQGLLDPSISSNNGITNPNGNPPLDLFLAQYAQKKKMEVLGLETIQEQVSVFSAISLKEQATMLYQTATAPQDGISELEELIRLYLSEDIQRMVELTGKDTNEAFVHALLDRRNAQMALRIRRHLETKRLFIGVGAAHLGGDTGILALLRKYGYHLRPVGDWKTRAERRTSH